MVQITDLDPEHTPNRDYVAQIARYRGQRFGGLRVPDTKSTRQLSATQSALSRMLKHGTVIRESAILAALDGRLVEILPKSKKPSGSEEGKPPLEAPPLVPLEEPIQSLKREIAVPVTPRSQKKRHGIPANLAQPIQTDAYLQLPFRRQPTPLYPVKLPEYLLAARDRYARLREEESRQLDRLSPDDRIYLARAFGIGVVPDFDAQKELETIRKLLAKLNIPV